MNRQGEDQPKWALGAEDRQNVRAEKGGVVGPVVSAVVADGVHGRMPGMLSKLGVQGSIGRVADGLIESDSARRRRPASVRGSP